MRKPINHHIEILPAALLPHRGEWQTVAASLPANACLLVTNPENQEQIQFMLEIARVFRENGREVIVWTAREKEI